MERLFLITNKICQKPSNILLIKKSASLSMLFKVFICKFCDAVVSEDIMLDSGTEELCCCAVGCENVCFATILFVYWDISDLDKEIDQKVQKKLNDYFGSKQPTKKNDYTGYFKVMGNKNVCDIFIKNHPFFACHKSNIECIFKNKVLFYVQSRAK